MIGIRRQVAQVLCALAALSSPAQAESSSQASTSDASMSDASTSDASTSDASMSDASMSDASNSKKQKKKERDICDDGFFGVRTVPDYCKNSSRDSEFTILPAIFSQKETSLGFALYGEWIFYADDKPRTQPSRLALSFAYTLNQQFLMKIPTFINLDNNDIIIEGYADFRIYPNRYYGIGNDSDWSYQLYSESVITTAYEFRHRIWGPLYVGAVWNLRSTLQFTPKEHYDEFGEEFEDSSDGPLEQDAPLGAEDNFNHGLGVQLVYDTRDDFYAPTTGSYHRNTVSYYGNGLGGNYDYLLWLIDARRYFKLAKNQVLAVQVINEFRLGDVPFTSMAEMGGPFTMRGYFKGRYRDLHMTVLQAEYRYPIYRRLSGVAFANAGEVYGETAFEWERLRWTAGAGLRFRFGDRTFIRLDVGANQETYAGVFNGGHAF